MRPDHEAATALNAITIDSRSTIASALRADLVNLQSSCELTSETLGFAVTLALARLEACVFGELDDPTVRRD